MPDAINAVLFDLDNTLADRDQAFIGWARWFARTQLGLTDDAGIEAAVSTLVQLDADGYTPRDALFRAIEEHYAFPVGDAEVLVAEFRGELMAHLPPLDAGATDFLKALDEVRMPWGIVTNGSSLSQRSKIRKLSLEHRAGCIVISEEIGIRKPDPGIFRFAAERLSVAASDVMFVGDHPEADILGAANAGMRTAWLRRGRPWPIHLTPIVPDFIIDSLHDLMWVAEAGSVA